MNCVTRWCFPNLIHMSCTNYAEVCRLAMEDATPAVVSLRQLHRLNYRTGDNVPTVHCLTDTPKVFGNQSQDFSSRRAYLQCLVNFECLSGRGLVELRSDQLETYYQMVLKSAEPHLVPLNATALQLKAFLNASAICDSVIPVLPIDDGHVSEPDDDAVVVPAPSRRRQLRTAPVTARGPGRRKVFTGSSSSSTDSSDGGTSDSDAHPSVIVVEGARVSLEQHLEPGDAGFYRRCVITCTNESHWSSDGTISRRCRKKRNIDDSLGREGLKCTLAFCGMWIRSCRQFETRRQHMHFKPSQASVDDYISRGNVLGGDVDTLLPS